MDLFGFLIKPQSSQRRRKAHKEKIERDVQVFIFSLSALCNLGVLCGKINNSLSCEKIVISMCGPELNE